jgi:phosphomannomutase
LEAEDWVRPWLVSLREKVTIGFVGGSDLPKQKEQLGEDVQDMFDYCFAENGLVAFKGKDKLSEHSFKAEMDPDQLKKLINFILMYVAPLDIPVKRGTFIEFRSGMLNVSPIGRNCSQDERMAFYKYDQEHKIREKMINVIKAEFPHLKLTYSIGGQISFDVFPTGWDKTYCLKFLEQNNFKEIHFFGDKTYKGGNDHESNTKLPKLCV